MVWLRFLWVYAQEWYSLILLPRLFLSGINLVIRGECYHMPGLVRGSEKSVEKWPRYNIRVSTIKGKNQTNVMERRHEGRSPLIIEDHFSDLESKLSIENAKNRGNWSIFNTTVILSSGTFTNSPLWRRKAFLLHFLLISHLVQKDLNFHLWVIRTNISSHLPQDLSGEFIQIRIMKVNTLANITYSSGMGILPS